MNTKTVAFPPVRAFSTTIRDRDPQRRDPASTSGNGKAGLATKRALILCFAVTVCAWAPRAFGQPHHVLKGYVTAIPVHNLAATENLVKPTETLSPQTVSNPLPSWNYSVVAYDGNTYTGTILGRSPYYNGKTTTTLPIQIVPLVITIKDVNGTVVYDPTATDACVTGHTAEDIIVNSPLFTNTTWVMNSVNMGNTQYEDAGVRAEFWELLGNTPYHLTLQESSLASQALSFGTGGTSGAGSNYPASELGTCEPLGVVEVNDMDNAIQALIAGPLAAQVNIGTFPLFLTKNVVMSEGDTNLFGSNCCVLGFHSAFAVGANLQVYGPFEVDTAEAFGPGFTTTMAHEVGEAVNDPNGSNPTPPWGNQGQQPGCQDNFEVGDPLSDGGIPPTSNNWVISAANGLTYDLQELAFFSWFYGTPDLGTPGFYSNNGAFTGYAKACPPGGTN
ncbi:MAG: hypothetical protein ABSF98_14160 [Bryobacteraceae bacterium]|jgi:hypothetical protein